MAYRNGTYVAFNGCGTTNPTEGDMKYYGLLQKWNKENNFDLNFSDSHKKTYSVLDSSLTSTLKARLMERMRNSKHMLLILTENSSWNRGLLNFEIEKAVDLYEIPIIAAYTDFDFILDTFKVATLKKYWPDALKKRIESGDAKVLHISFRQKPIAYAVKNYSIHDSQIEDSLRVLPAKNYQDWGLMLSLPIIKTKNSLTPKLPQKKDLVLPHKKDLILPSKLKKK